MLHVNLAVSPPTCGLEIDCSGRRRYKGNRRRDYADEAEIQDSPGGRYRKIALCPHPDGNEGQEHPVHYQSSVLHVLWKAVFCGMVQLSLLQASNQERHMVEAAS